MIKPQELRIGNYYLGASRGKIEAVTWQTLRDLHEGQLNINPIPITEEWLLKFGFEEKSKSKNFYLGNFRFHISKPANYDGFIFCDGYDVITDRIKYVHQLQNLFFCLCGEELQFKQTT